MLERFELFYFFILEAGPAGVVTIKTARLEKPHEEMSWCVTTRCHFKKITRKEKTVTTVAINLLICPFYLGFGYLETS